MNEYEQDILGFNNVKLSINNMINLNDSKKYVDKPLSKDDILKHYTDYDIFKMYLGDFTIGETFESPIRTGDNNPSFNVFYSKINNCLLFKDFAGKRGDFVVLVQELFHLPTYQDALHKIAFDIGLTHQLSLAQLNSKKEPIDIDLMRFKHTPYEIMIKKREWSLLDIEYWKQFEISLRTLKHFNVVPIEGYFNSSFYVNTPDLAFAYLEYKDDRLTYKIYRPLAIKRNKWRNNNPYGVHQGYRQLPKTGNLMIITKALKEVMSLYETIKIPSVGIQSETCFMKDSVVDEYKHRFVKVVTLFDNDKQGIEHAVSYRKLYNIDAIFIPEEYKAKNYSDLIESFDKDKAVEILKSLL
jgi:hypothetical protein